MVWHQILVSVCFALFIGGIFFSIFFMILSAINIGHVSHDISADHDISHDISADHDISHDISADHDISHDISADHDIS
ncbi:MAG: hypothetical protein ACTSRZ_16520, partial [Promethearchaeota archaeon]